WIVRRMRPRLPRRVTTSGVATLLPQHVAAAAGAVEHAREHEEQIGQAVQVLPRRLADRLVLGQRDDGALGAAADGTGLVRQRRGARAAGQDEVLERFERVVEAVERLFQLLDLLRGDQARTGDAQLAAEVEEVMLHA